MWATVPPVELHELQHRFLLERIVAADARFYFAGLGCLHGKMTGKAVVIIKGWVNNTPVSRGRRRNGFASPTNLPLYQFTVSVPAEAVTSISAWDSMTTACNISSAD